MKKFVKTFGFIIVLLCIFNVFTSDINSYTGIDLPSYSSEVVLDVKTNRVLYGQNIHLKRYPASTTKILTALCVINSVSLDDVVEVGADTVGVEGSSIYLQVGESLTVRELLYGLMLRSGNDCAETLAKYCSGSIKDFARLMNETARNIGATESNFINPHGLHDDNHYTTAYDLALITSCALKNESFREIVATKSVDISAPTGKRHLINKNKMLNRLDGCTGVKTGFTKKAGRCLVTSCKRDDVEFVSVVLNCAPMWEETEKLLNTAFNEYHPCKIVNKNEILDFIENDFTDEKIGVYAKNDVILALKESEINLLTLAIENAHESKPIKKDDLVAYLNIYCANKLIFTEKLYSIYNVLNQK